jgi:tetratricopeptide (TPR) repeat protein
MLNNLGADLWDRGRVAEALEPMDEAIGIWRRLAKRDPRRWRPELARSARNRGQFLARLGRAEDALASLQESVDLFGLAAAADLSLLPALDGAFSQLADTSAELGRPADAVAALRQEVEVYAGLAAVNAAQVGPHLAGALSTLGLALAQLGSHEDALDAARQAVGIFRVSRSDLTTQQEIFEAMAEIGALYQAGRGADARAVTERLVRRHPRLADVDQLINVAPQAVSAQRVAAIDGGLAGALYLAGDELAQLGRFQEALAPAEEAATILRRLKESHPADFGGWLGRALDSLAAILTALGRHDAARRIQDERRSEP